MKQYIKYITIIIILVIILTGCDLLEKEEIESSSSKIGKLNYSVPNTFKKSNLSNDKTHIYRYKEEHFGNVCNFSITATTPFNTNLDIVVRSYLISADNYNIKEKKIANQIWKYATDSRKTKGIYYVYATIYQDTLYVIQYDDIAKTTYCNDMLKKIIKSMKVEE